MASDGQMSSDGCVGVMEVMVVPATHPCTMDGCNGGTSQERLLMAVIERLLMAA